MAEAECQQPGLDIVIEGGSYQSANSRWCSTQHDQPVGLLHAVFVFDSLTLSEQSGSAVISQASAMRTRKTAAVSAEVWEPCNRSFSA